MGFQYPHSDKEFSNHSFPFDLPGRSAPPCNPTSPASKPAFARICVARHFLNKFTVYRLIIIIRKTLMRVTKRFSVVFVGLLGDTLLSSNCSLLL